MKQIIQQHEQQKSRGAVMVEFALVAPVFFFVLFACLEFARISMIRNSVENIAYEGARQGIIPGATEEKINDKVQPLLKAIGVSNAVVTVNPSVVTNSTETVTVEITVDLQKNSWVMGKFTPNHTITKKITMTRERTSIYKSGVVSDATVATKLSTASAAASTGSQGNSGSSGNGKSNGP